MRLSFQLSANAFSQLADDLAHPLGRQTEFVGDLGLAQGSASVQEIEDAPSIGMGLGHDGLNASELVSREHLSLETIGVEIGRDAAGSLGRALVGRAAFELAAVIEEQELGLGEDHPRKLEFGESSGTMGLNDPQPGFLGEFLGPFGAQPLGDQRDDDASSVASHQRVPVDDRAVGHLDGDGCSSQLVLRARLRQPQIEPEPEVGRDHCCSRGHGG